MRRFPDVVDNGPADLNLFGMAPELDLDVCRTLMWSGRASAVFLKGGGSENALA